MPITTQTEEQIRLARLADFRTEFPTKDLTDKGFLGLIAHLFAQSAVLSQDQIREADNDGCPAYQQDADGTLRSKTSTEGLDRWAFVFGLLSDVAGVYGRRGASISTGGVATPSTTAPAVLIAANSQAVDSTGQIVVKTAAAVTTNGPPNTNTISLVSVTTGTAANLSSGTTLTWSSPGVGLDPTFTLTTGLSGGLDRESDIELLVRLLFRLQNPPRGGAPADYRVWGEESTNTTTGASLSIYRAYVFPLRNGAGTVDVMALYNGSGTGRDIGATVAALVLAYINTKRPVGATVRVIRPYMPAGLALRLRVRPTPSLTRYNYDWVDAGASTLVTAYDSVAKTLRFTGTLPNLEAAITLGKKPRIQVIVTTATAVPTPYQVRVTAFDVVTVPGSTVLTLETAVGVAPTVATDYFYAGGPLVEPIAQRILDLIDNLGPSRQSGYADANDAWDYKVSVSRVVDEVMDTVDTDGTRMVSVIANLGTTGVQIAVGAGAFTANDHEPRDLTGNCELAFLRAGGIEVLSA